MVNIAPAVGWPNGRLPTAAAGMRANAFATGLDHPRWLYVLPNGDVLVAETNAPSKPDDGKGLRGWFMGLVMKRAGAAAPSADRITVLRDTDGDGVADLRSVLLSGLNSPFGMALVDDALYVAASDAVLKFPYKTGDLRIVAKGMTVVALPAGPINHHWTKNLIASADGRTLYVTVGSNSNVGERGMEAEIARAAIWRVEIASGEHRIFASGLRNPNGMAWETDTGQLWTVVNERDEIGDDLVPDYMTSVREGGFYGWPYSYYGQHVDTRVQPQRPNHAGLRPGFAYRAAGSGVFRRHQPARAFRARHVHRPARLVEPENPRRLQGDFRTVRARQARRPPHRCADGFRRRTGPCLRSSGRRGAGSQRRAAGRRRCRQRDLAGQRDAVSAIGDRIRGAMSCAMVRAAV